LFLFAGVLDHALKRRGKTWILHFLTHQRIGGIVPHYNSPLAILNNRDQEGDYFSGQSKITLELGDQIKDSATARVTAIAARITRLGIMCD
jgi:hypothetical protein